MAGLAHHPLRSCIALAYCAPLCVADGAAKAKLNIIRAVLAADETPRSRRSLAREARKVPVDRNAWDARRNGFQNPGISGGSHWGREPGVVPPKVLRRALEGKEKPAREVASKLTVLDSGLEYRELFFTSSDFPESHFSPT